MIDSLQHAVDEIQRQAKEKEVGFGVIQCKSENMAIVIGNGKPILITMVEGKTHNTIIPMRINIKKWVWALNEGFDKEKLFDEFSEEIFSVLTEKAMMKQLGLD